MLKSLHFKIIPLLFTFLLSCCSNIHVVKKHVGIDPAFGPYVTQVIVNSKGSLKYEDFKGFSIAFETPDDKESLALCKPIVREIIVKKSFWIRASEEDRYETIAHEIGHCILGRYHTNHKFSFWHDALINLGLIKNTGYLRDGCPTSFMHPYNMSDYCIMRHYEYYNEELFGRADRDSYQDFYIWNR